MLAPFDTVKIDALLDELPQRAELAEERDALPDGVEDVVDLGVSGEAADAEADTAVRALVAVAQRAEHVRGLERGGCARGAGRERDVFQGHEEGLALDVGEGDVDAAGVVFGRVAVEGGVFHGEKAVGQTLGELGDALGVVLYAELAGVRASTLQVKKCVWV